MDQDEKQNVEATGPFDDIRLKVRGFDLMMLRGQVFAQIQKIDSELADIQRQLQAANTQVKG